MLSTFSDLLHREYFRPDSTFTPALRRRFQSNHVVFLDGLLNEAAQLVGNYYCDNINEVERLGLSYTHLGYLSSETIPSNADRLFAEIHKIHSKVKRPIILVGHSKGGAECLYCILKNPELLTSNIVDRVVLMHPAVGGSPLADNVCDNFMGRRFTAYLAEGLDSLKPAIAKRNFQKILRTFRRTILLDSPETTMEEHLKNYDEICSLDNKLFKKLSDRVFYLRGNSPGGVICWGVQFVVAFCNHPLDPNIPNDGLLHCDDQYLSDFGTDLGILDFDHIDMVIGGMVTNARPDKRKAYTRAFLTAIYQSEMMEHSLRGNMPIESSFQNKKIGTSSTDTADQLSSLEKGQFINPVDKNFNYFSAVGAVHNSMKSATEFFLSSLDQESSSNSSKYAQVQGQELKKGNQEYSGNGNREYSGNGNREYSVSKSTMDSPTKKEGKERTIQNEDSIKKETTEESSKPKNGVKEPSSDKAFNKDSFFEDFLGK